MHKTLLVFCAAAAITLPCAAVETQSWIQNEQADFDTGVLKRLSLRSDGRLMLAPVSEQILDSSTPYLWAITGDSKGNIYTGGGGPGSSSTPLTVIDSSRRARTLADVPGLQIQSIAVSRDGQVFAGTAPDGKVFRISNGKAEVFYDPKAKYIWAMAFNSKGELFVATGDSGEIHKVAPDGKGSVFFRTEETHARSLAIDPKDNLIIGTEPSGLILRISPAGEGFVLYQSPKREITAVAVGRDGLVYAAAVGNRGPRNSDVAPLSVAPLPIPPAPVNRAGGGTTTVVTTTTPPPTAPPAAPSTIPGGSELYRIESDGFPRKLWAHAQEIVYAIGFDSKGLPVLGTGNKGKVFRVDNENLSTLLIDAEPTQITALYNAPDGRLYAATGNIGKIYRIGPELEKTGTYESDAFDAGFFSYWGRVALKGNGRVETRSGNLERSQSNWSPWAAPVGDRVASPPARFLQHRLTLTGAEEVSEIDIAYQSRNVAPSINLIEITPPNYKFPPPATPLGVGSTTLSLPALGQRRQPAAPSVETTTTPALTAARYYLGARWTASDPNGDTMEYSVFIRGEKENGWKPLKEGLREKYISWDSSAFPDGAYLLRIDVSDAPDNTPEQTLRGSRESDRFIIDNTPPQITALAANKSGSGFKVSWSAKDALSNITRAEYTVDGGDWKLVQPATRLFDSPQLSFELSVNGLTPAEHTIAIRVTDEFDNQGVDKIVLR